MSSTPLSSQRSQPSWFRPRRPSWSREPRRVAFAGMLVGAVAWAFAWGAHGHTTVIASDLSAATVSRTYVIDASTALLDLSGIQVAPGEVVEFVLDGSAGAPHAFVLSGAAPGAEIDQSLAPDGDTVIRLRVPLDGGLAFTCVIPGHEGLHGSLVVTPPGAR